MSGAFNIDIEVGNGLSKGKIRIYCASLTDTWDVERNSVALAQFHTALSNEKAVQTNKINVGQCPKAEDLPRCELFLSRLGCTAAVLRLKCFHDFLNIPKSVRDGLLYASHKPFGKMLRESYMQKHPRFVRRGGGKRWLKLTKDDRGGSLICYPDENNKNLIISSLKIGASTEIQNLKDRGIPNAFVLKSGKRQWVLQTSSPKDFTMWQSQLIAMLKEFGPVNIGSATTENSTETNNNTNKKPVVSSLLNKIPKLSVKNILNKKSSQNNVATAKLLKENQDLTIKIKKMNDRVKRLHSDIEKYKELEIEMESETEDQKRKQRKKFAKEKENLIAEYEVKQDNLRGEIEELHKKLENKTIKDGGYSALKTLFTDYVEINIDDYKEGDKLDDKNGDKQVGRANTTIVLDDFGGDDEKNSGGRIKYYHKHLHRHDHKHIHNHRHTHIHDHTDDTPSTYTHTHTIAHTITHTNTQFKIKKKLI